MKIISVLLITIMSSVFFACSSVDDNSLEPNNTNPDSNVESNNNTDNSKLINLNLLSSYKADIMDAKALGIRRKKITNNTRAADVTVKNYIVKTTEDYGDASYSYENSQLSNITFTKIITDTEATESVSIEEIVANEDGLCFQAIENMVYNIYDSLESLIYETVADNDEDDKDSKNGIILLKNNIIADIKYVIRGYKYEENPVITQEQLNGEIDKLYVFNNYVFISFVPLGTTGRPAEENLEYDEDGIALYDKCTYYSDNSRQSFVIDSTTGLIYPIKDFYIKRIENGLLTTNTDNFLYDIKINSKLELEIYALFTNTVMKWDNCFKDKYGNNFVNNDIFNQYDESTNTYYYTFCMSAWSKNNWGGVNYVRTSNNEALEMKMENCNEPVTSLNIMLGNKQKRELKNTDNFSLYYNLREHGWRYYSAVRNGVLLGHAYHSNKWEVYHNHVIVIDLKNNIYREDNMYSDDNKCKNNYDFIEDYDVILQIDDNDVYYYDNIWDSMLEDGRWEKGDHSNKHLLATNILFDWPTNSFERHTLNGTTYYEIIVSGEVDSKEVEFVEIGSYQKASKKIILQPINR